MGQALISVIVPVYNAKTYLPQCVDALLSQTYRDFEIILVDDGSTDGSAGLCDAFREKDSRVIVIHQANKGPGAARNAGLERAAGEYVCFVDADDRVSREYLRTLAEKTEGTDLVICAMTKIPEELDTKAPEAPRRVTRPVVENLFSGGSVDGYLWNKIFRRSILEAYRVRMPEDIFLWEDMLFFVNYIRHIDSILFIPDRLYYYREHDGQLTSQNDGKHLLQSAQLVKSARAFLACGIDSDAYVRWAQRVLIRSEITYISAMLRDSGTPVSDVKAELSAARKAGNKHPYPLACRMKLWALSGLALGKGLMAGRKNAAERAKHGRGSPV